MATIIIDRVGTINFSGVTSHQQDSRTNKLIFEGNINGFINDANADAGPITAYNQATGGGTERLSHDRNLTGQTVAHTSSPKSVNLPPGRLSAGRRSVSRFNPIAVPANRPATYASHKRKASRSSKSEESDEEFRRGFSIADAPRRETVRKQRIESEQRRRDELKEGYSRLEQVTPASDQKKSNVDILDGAIVYIKSLEAITQQLDSRLQVVDHEVDWFRNANESLMLIRPAYSAFSNAV